MKNVTILTAMSVMLALFSATGCTNQANKSPDVKGAVRQSLDQVGLKDVSVDQDRTKGVITLGGHVPSEDAKNQADARLREEMAQLTKKENE